MSEHLETGAHKFPRVKDFIRIVPISCLHIGHRNFNRRKASGYLDYILQTPDTYTIMLGDTIENVITETAGRHPGSIHDQILSVEEQRSEAVKLLSPLAKAGKILAWTESNHSLRSWYAAGFSVEKWIAEKLGVPFYGTDCLLEILVGKCTYYLHATHGTGGGTSTASAFGKLMAQRNRVQGADVYIRGHHHKKILFDNKTIDAKSGAIQKQVLGATGCFMDYVEGYGHRAELPPTELGCIKIKLYAKKWDIHATL